MTTKYIKKEEIDKIKISECENVIIFDKENHDDEVLLKVKERLIKNNIEVLGTVIHDGEKYVLTSEANMENKRKLSKEELELLMTKRKKLMDTRYFSERFKTHHDVERSYKDYIESEMIKPGTLNIKELTSKHDQAGLYIHIPFCDRICSFCNLQRTRLTDEVYEYVEKLVADIKSFATSSLSRSTKIDAIYFGGGTPTTLTLPMFEAIFEAIHEAFTLTPNCEVTIESTLHNLDDLKLSGLIKLGVNRLSFGIQTFDNEGRTFFNRTGNQEYVVERLKQIREQFWGTISIDIIYNYPTQTLERLQNDIKLFEKLNLDSVSYYSLMIHQGSRLSNKYSIDQLSNKYDEIFHDYFIDQLVNGNSRYQQNEITKICDPNIDRYRYIDLRHQGYDIIPFGKGAGGNVGQYGIYNIDVGRRMVAKNLGEYDHQIKLLKGITQSATLNLTSIKKHFQETEITLIKTILQEFVAAGLYLQNEEIYKQTKLGTFYGNNMSAMLVTEFLRRNNGK